MTWEFKGPDPSVLKHRIDTATRDGLFDGLELVLNMSNRHVPHEEGHLERSGNVSVETTATGQIRGVVSYNTPYAVRQHEDMTYRHDAGRNAKFLENAFNSERRTVATLIRDRIAAQMRP
jgi:hypothetical protein